MAIYQSLKDAIYENGKSYVAICFKDIYALKRAGIVHKDVGKVRTDLKKITHLYFDPLTALV